MCKLRPTCPKTGCAPLEQRQRPRLPHPPRRACRASLHRAAFPDGPMRPKEARAKRGKKQRRCSRGKEGESKDRIKKQKKGDYNATLQPWREQTATVKVSSGPDYYLHT